MFSDDGGYIGQWGNAGNGTNITVYSYDNVKWHTYNNSPLTISDEGNNVLYFYSTDIVGHVEPINAQNIRIDHTKPTLSYSIIAGTPVDGWYTGNVTVHFIANDRYRASRA